MARGFRKSKAGSEMGGRRAETKSKLKLAQACRRDETEQRTDWIDTTTIGKIIRWEISRVIL
jgi:hypothetical protein